MSEQTSCILVPAKQSAKGMVRSVRNAYPRPAPETALPHVPAVRAAPPPPPAPATAHRAPGACSRRASYATMDAG